MSSIALGMQVNELDARIEKLETQDMLTDILILHGAVKELRDRIKELESMVAMMRHAIDVAVLDKPAPPKMVYVHDQGGAPIVAAEADTYDLRSPEDPFPLNDSPIAPIKPARVKATKA